MCVAVGGRCSCAATSPFGGAPAARRPSPSFVDAAGTVGHRRARRRRPPTLRAWLPAAVCGGGTEGESRGAVGHRAGGWRDGCLCSRRLLRQLAQTASAAHGGWKPVRQPVLPRSVAAVGAPAVVSGPRNAPCVLLLLCGWVVALPVTVFGGVARRTDRVAGWWSAHWRAWRRPLRLHGRRPRRRHAVNTAADAAATVNHPS